MVFLIFLPPLASVVWTDGKSKKKVVLFQICGLIFFCVKSLHGSMKQCK